MNSWMAIFVSTKAKFHFFAIGPDHTIEQVNRVMKILGGLKGLTQNPSAMARWFLVSHELSRLASEAEKLVGVCEQNSTQHNDLSISSLEHYEHNVEKLRETMKINNPFLVTEEELVNIMTRAIMPDQVKEALMRADIIRQELFPKFVRETC